MFNFRRGWVIPAVVVFMLLVFSVPTVFAAVGFTPITGSPLTINVASDASYQIFHDGVDPSTPGQVYYTLQSEADSGIFVWYGGYAIGPDFFNHDFSAVPPYDAWVNVGQSGVSGAGTGGNPWKVITNLVHPASGVTLETTTSYVNGSSFFTIGWKVCTPAAGDLSTFIAADFYLQGSDAGFGYYDPATGAVGGYNATQDWYEVMVPHTPATHHQADFYGTIWGNIGTAGFPGPGFNDYIETTYMDNGGGLQWDTRINGCASFAVDWSFAITPPVIGRPPSTSSTNVTTNFPPPPPVPLCADLSGSTNPIIRAEVPNGTVTNGNVFCRVLVENQTFVQNAAEIGDATLLGMSILQAVDVFGLTLNGSPYPAFNNSIMVCLQGSGTFYFLDATAAPRVLQAVDATSQDGYTCAHIPHAGTIALVAGGAAPPAAVNVANTNSVLASLSNCQVTTTHQVRLRTQPDTSGIIITTLPYQITLQATARQGNWFQVIYESGQGWVSADYLTSQGNC